MKFAAKTLSALAAAGLLMGAMGAPAIAKKAEQPKNIFEIIEADLKALDKAIFGPFTKK